MKRGNWIPMLILTGLLVPRTSVLGGEGRATVSLNGAWQIDESVSATEMPKAFGHTVAVPGWVNLSTPAFPDVDFFASREYMQRYGREYPLRSGKKILSDSAPLPTVGISPQKRNYFWYRTSFKAGTKREVALLKIGKAQFGTAVWLNGTKVGEHLSCWTPGYFDLTSAIHWTGDNELLVRVGAHPGVLPESFPAGTIQAKTRWTPGIYDDVSLILCDNPVIESIQVAPRLDTSEVTIQTKVRNYGAARDFELRHRIKTWKEGREVTQSAPQGGRLEAGEEKTLSLTVRLDKAHLWSPEDPFLYAVESRTGGDSVQTRFGMREVRFDNATGRAFLNGKQFFLRGGNLEFSSCLGDPRIGRQPWDRQWVRKLIAEVPKSLNWNAFRFVISVVPDMWLDIADEEGILIQYEPSLWEYHPQWSTKGLISLYTEWMQNNWNHPCVFMWDASNETSAPELIKVIKAVRTLDLSDRAWENSYNYPERSTDPSEVHCYIFSNDPKFADFDFRRLNGFDVAGAFSAGHIAEAAKVAGKPVPKRLCYILNEYAWVWLYSDGTPADGVDQIYQRALPNGTAEERLDYRWYISGALTEMFRASRSAVGVLYYAYFGSSVPRPAPCDYHFGAFADVDKLQLQPSFEKYMTEAFKPLGVYIDFWGDGAAGKRFLQQWAPLRSGAQHEFSITLINDESGPVAGKLVLSLEKPDGGAVASREVAFHLDGLGRNVYKLGLAIPKEEGKYLLKAVAHSDGAPHDGPTVCRRKVLVQPVP